MFAAFLGRVGGGVLDPDQVDAGRISKKCGLVPVYHNPERLDDIEPDVTAPIVAKLAAPPKSSLVLGSSSAPDTNKLAIEVAIAFAE